VRLTRESRYAIEALVELVSAPPGELVEAREIAERAHLPAPFLSKILRSLAAGGVLRSQRGRGYALARPPDRIVLGDVLRIVEGHGAIWDTCIFWREDCDEARPCPLHFRWAELKPDIQQAMGSVTLADVAAHGLAPGGTAGEHLQG
jgi:Rrf2 family transcriptional regulator, iron-sulfur cluster assembly transcription factor